MSDPINPRRGQIPPFNERPVFVFSPSNLNSGLEQLRSEMRRELKELKELMYGPRNNGCAGMWRFKAKEIQP